MVSPTAADVLIERLRELGLAPAAEGGDGAVLTSRPDERRTGPRAKPRRLVSDPPAPSPTVAASIVRALRAAERGARRQTETKGPGLGTDVPRTAMAETLAVAVNRERGHIDDALLAEVRGAGVSDTEIVEVVAHVALNVFTNSLNNVAGTDIDFPKVALSSAA